MRPLKVQLAFQGGGAKIFSLLAAAEAIEILQRRGDILVTRVAGASAGAIVACLLASGRAGSIRSELRRIPESQWKNLLPAVPFLSQIWKLYNNEPFWNPQPIRKFLATFFDEQGFRTLSDLKKASGIDVFIMAADVTNSKKKVYSDEHDPIVNSLLDSCALPFVLRTAKNNDGQVIVDGGICENLPAEELEAGVQDFGQVIGISFDSFSPGEPPKNAWQLGRALLETAMNNAVLRTRRRLGNNAVFSIETKIGTFDFEKALKTGLDESYDNIMSRALGFFDEIKEVSRGQRHVLIGDPWRHGSPEIMAKLSAIYAAQHGNIKLEYISNSIIVQANCLLEPGDPRFSQPDLVKHSLTFKPAGAAVHCHKISLASGSGEFLGKASWSVRDVKGRERLTIMLPIVDPAGKTSKRELLLFFDPIIEEEDTNAPYTIVFQDLVMNSMIELRDKHEDSLSLSATRCIRDSGRVDLILLVPSDFPRLGMTALPLEDGSPGPEGRPMTPGELARFDVPPGFVALGWTGSSPEAQVPFGVNFRSSG